MSYNKKNGTMWFLKLYSWNQTSDDSQIVVVATIYHTTRKMSVSIIRANQWIYSLHISWLFSENSAASRGEVSGRVPE